jgi:hypothetical protein
MIAWWLRAMKSRGYQYPNLNPYIRRLNFGLADE